MEIIYFKKGMPVYWMGHMGGQEPGYVIDDKRPGTYCISVDFDGKICNFTFDGKRNSLVVIDGIRNEGSFQHKHIELFQNKILINKNMQLPEIGDMGYFWDDKNSNSALYGKLTEITIARYRHGMLRASRLCL